MAPLTDDDLAGFTERARYADGTVVRVFCRRTSDDAYPSGWAYTLHYGMIHPDPPRTLTDGTIRRYDNSHEDTKGHELHLAPDREPDMIDFPGMASLWRRFWVEIPKPEFDIE